MAGVTAAVQRDLWRPTAFASANARTIAGMAREDPYKLPASWSFFGAINVAVLRKMARAPNAGVALPFGGPGQLWQRVAISLATDNGSWRAYETKNRRPRKRGRRAGAAHPDRVCQNCTTSLSPKQRQMQDEPRDCLHRWVQPLLRSESRSWSEVPWLDLQVLAESLLLPDQELRGVRYFTARVRDDPDGGRRQSVYLDALSTHCEKVIRVEGRFQEKHPVAAAAVPAGLGTKRRRPMSTSPPRSSKTLCGTSTIRPFSFQGTLTCAQPSPP